MKILTTALLVLCASAGSLLGQQKEKAQALLAIKGEFVAAWLVDGNNKTLRFSENEDSTLFKDVTVSSLETLYFMEPADFTAAMELFRSRKYSDARAQFAAAAAKYKWLQGIAGNYSTLSIFYQMECCRKLGELDALKALLDSFLPEPLLREVDRQQVDIYKYWEAVRGKSWSRLVEIADSEMEKHYPGALRAQISYCLGMAYEGLDEPRKALTAFNGGFISDFAASEVVARNSALGCLRLLSNDEDVKQAIKLYGTKDANPNSEGSQLLKEANAVAKLWDIALGGGAPLPEEYKIFLKYDVK